jgi:hypothetical protein
MKKALGLAIVATFLATPALAGETFVRNEDSWSHSKTYTNLKLDSKTYSARIEKYGSEAHKVYFEGDKYDSSNVSEVSASTVACDSWCDPTKGSDDSFSKHTASSYLKGFYYETNYTKLGGTIKTKTHTYTDAHETSAGVR